MRNIYAAGADANDRVSTLVDDDYVAELAQAVAGQLGGRVGVAPRLYLRKLIDVMDRVDQFDDYRPRRDYPLTVSANELNDLEREAAHLGDLRGASSVDDVDLDL